MDDVRKLAKWLGAGLLAAAALGWSAPASAADAGAARVLSMKVTDKGFEPAELKVKKGESLILRVTRTTDETCATDLLIEGTSVNVALPLGKAVDVAFSPTRAGKLKFGCAMGKMIGGVLLVE